jgi:hypothetical protein
LGTFSGKGEDARRDLGNVVRLAMELSIESEGFDDDPDFAPPFGGIFRRACRFLASGLMSFAFAIKASMKMCGHVTSNVQYSTYSTYKPPNT